MSDRPIPPAERAWVEQQRNDSDIRLDDLATTINNEFRLANESAQDAVSHAIACGEALKRARDEVRDGQWVKWLTNNVDVSVRVATQWVRLANHKNLIPAQPTLTVEGVARYLRELHIPPASHSRTGQEPSFDVAEAKALRRQGWTYRQLGDAFGVNPGTVRVHLDHSAYLKQKDQSLERSRRRRTEKRLLVGLRRDAAVKKAGGDLSIIYAWLRKSALMVDTAIVESDDARYREQLRLIQAGLSRAEGATLKALRIK